MSNEENVVVEFTKRRVTVQHTEIAYYQDGVEIGREHVYDDHEYDADAPEPMTADEIDDWGVTDD